MPTSLKRLSISNISLFIKGKEDPPPLLRPQPSCNLYIWPSEGANVLAVLIRLTTWSHFTPPWKKGGKKVLVSSSCLRIILMSYLGTRRTSNSYVMCECGTDLFYSPELIRKKSLSPQFSMSPSYKVWGLFLIYFHCQSCVKISQVWFWFADSSAWYSLWPTPAPRPRNLWPSLLLPFLISVLPAVSCGTGKLRG